VQIEEEGVHVLFACNCMTFDQTETKFWNNGEYEPLDACTLEEKLEAHALHCPFGVQFSMVGFPSNEIIFQGNTQEYNET